MTIILVLECQLSNFLNKLLTLFGLKVDSKLNV
jgi:hypothetical protein